MANWLMKRGGIASRPQIVHSGGGQPVEIGEGGEKEYVVPESKLKPFAQSVQSGRPANPATLPRMQGGGILDPNDPNNFLTPPFLPPGLVQPTGAQPVGPVQGPGPAPLGPPTGQVGPPPGVGEPPPLGTPGQPPPPPAPQVAAPNYRFDPDNPAAPVPQQRSLQQQAILGEQHPSVLKRIGGVFEGLASGGIPGAVEGGVHPGRGEASRQLALQNQQATQQSNLATAEATREKTLADVGELGARAGYYKQQADTLAAEGKRAPKGNYISVGDGLFDAEAGEWIRVPTKASPDVLEIDPAKGQALGIKPTADGRYLIPKEGIGPYLTSQAKPPAAPTAESQKILFQNTLAKLSGAGELPTGALTDVNALAKVINSSKVLGPDDKSAALGYIGANTTPAMQGTTMTIRNEGYQQSRMYQMLDTKEGNAPIMVSAADLNEAKKNEPGRYIPAGAGTQALNKTALIEDIRGNVQQVRQSLGQIPEFSVSDKAKIAVAMRSRDPRSAISALVSGEGAATLTPVQQDYLINLTNLVENAMAMRSVLGAGQGSDELRTAITAVIPGPTTPSNRYARQQLDVFERTLNRLQRGVPKVPLRTDTGQTALGEDGRGNAGNKVVKWGRDANGNPVPK